MALIGTMKYLTIGNNTYEIEGGELPIASASTLGGIKVGSGLTIDSTTGVLNATGTSITIDNAMSDSSTNPVQNKVIKAYVDQYKGTVTSVRVQATSPVQSSTSTAQSTSLNTTISLADAYGDTKNPYGTKTANYILAGPSSGSAAAPSFRQLVAADIPDLSGTYLTSYTETDPVFSASAAAEITSTDISNWNAKVSDDKTWNGVTLSNGGITSSTVYVPVRLNITDTTAYNLLATITPTSQKIAMYNGDAYLNSTTPSANDNSTKVATTAYVDSAITALPEPMIFKGSLGTGGTITSLPTAAASNEGYTYKVITAGTYASQSAKVGDTFISDGSTWVLIPSGDEPSGTVTSVGLSNATDGGLSISGSPITSSGSITIGHSNVLTSAQTTSGIYPIKIDKNGHISEYGSAVSIPTKTSDLTNDSGYITSYTDENLKWTASTSSNTYYPLQSTSTATTSTANTLNGINFYQYYNTAGGYRRLNLGNATSWKSSGGAYGTIRLYGAAATYYGDLVPGVLGTTSGDGHISANRTWTLPDKTGTIALTSDLPTVPTNVSAFTNDAGYLTSYTETDPTVPSWAKAASKPTYTASEVGALASNTTYVSTITTTAGTHSAISSQSGAVSFNVPTHTSHLTNDSGFITSYTDEKVKSTPATTSTTYYLIGSTDSSENTATTSKHASLVAYTSSNSGTGGYTELRLGNATAASSAGGKAGTIRLYGTNATYYTTLKAGAVASSNKTITFPNASGTVALTSDIPTVPTNVSAFTNDAGYLTSYTETDPIFSASAAHGITSSDITTWNGKSDFSGDYTDLTNAPADYIVEQGTSGIWTYRKWNSGIAECWGEKSWTISSWTSWGNTYYTNYSGVINYPSGLFNAAPTVMTDGGISTGGDSWLATRGGVTYGGNKDHTASYFLMRGSSGSTNETACVHIHAIGTWK